VAISCKTSKRASSCGVSDIRTVQSEVVGLLQTALGFGFVSVFNTPGSVVKKMPWERFGSA